MTPRQWGLLALAMAFGVALRTAAIGREALWADEALTYVLAQAPALALAHAPIDPTAPLYYWLHAWLISDGAGAVVGRSIALVAGIFAVPAAFFLGRSIAGSGGAAVAGGWVAVSAPLVDYSQEARAYALLVLLILLSALALHATLRTMGPRRRWLLAAFSVTLVLALYTHFVALFWAVPAMGILMLRRTRANDKEALREAGLASGAIFIATIAEMSRVWRYATENNAFHWLKQPDAGDFAELVASQWFAFGNIALSGIAALLLVVCAIVHRRALATWARRDPAGALILAALLLQPLVLWLFGYLLSPVIMPRTLLASVPAVGIFIALLLAPLGGRARPVAGVAILGAALAATLVGGVVRPKEQWRGARAVLARADPARDLIVACPFWKAPALMAATRGLASAPLATPVDGRLLLVERQLGREPQWDRLTYARVYAAVLAPALGVEPPAEVRTMVPMTSLFVVTSECGEVERAAIANWAGRFTLVQRWTSEGRPEHAGITIERWTLDGPRTAAIRVAR